MELTTTDQYLAEAEVIKELISVESGQLVAQLNAFLPHLKHRHKSRYQSAGGAGALLLEEIGCCLNTFALAILLLPQGDLYSAHL